MKHEGRHTHRGSPAEPALRTREEWLEAGLTAIGGWARDLGYTVPREIRVSCGLPSRKAFSRKNQAIGQCWGPTSSADKHHEIFISPVLDQPVMVLGVLVHELVHAIVGNQAGHKAPFRKCAVELGLEGQMTATVPGERLTEQLTELTEKLGHYPHAKLLGSGSTIKRQVNRQLKAHCPDCGYIVRITRKWMEVGLPTCPCGTLMEEEV